MSSARPAPFLFILGAQLLGAFSEAFGQRASRRMHHHSHLRLLTSMAVWCSLQAFVVLAIAQYALPEQTGGQGSLSMWRSLVEHPELLLNAVNNSLYWLCLAFLFHEPAGAVLVVLAFLFASFLVNPFQKLFGVDEGSTLTAGPVVVGAIGALLCVLEIPLQYASAICGKVLNLLPCLDNNTCRQYGQNMGANLARSSSRLPRKQSEEPSPLVAVATGEDVTAPASETAPLIVAGMIAAPRSLFSCLGHWAHDAGVLIAFVVLALTTAVGISLTTFMQAKAGLTSAGYTAVDQVLLPFTTLPMVAAINRFAFCRRVIGEPAWSSESECAPSFWQIVKRTWGEVTARPSSTSHSSATVTSSSGGRRDEDRIGLGEDENGDENGPLFDEEPPRKRNLMSSTAEALDEKARTTASEVPTPAAVLQKAAGENAASSSPAAAVSASSLSSPRCGRATRCSRSSFFPLPFWLSTLAPFHFFEFVRTFVFFTLITSYETESTYLEMTLLRIALVFAVSLLVTTVLRRWAGMTKEETQVTLHPLNLATRSAGVVVLVLAILALKGML